MLLSLNAVYFQPSEFLQDSSELYYADADRIKKEMSPILPDFIPVTLTTTTVASDAIKCLSVSDCTNVQLLFQQSDEVAVMIEVRTDTVATLPVAAFPGWMVYVDDVKTAHRISDDGQLQVGVSAGSHEIRWRLGRSFIRAIADAMSLTVIMMTIVLVPILHWRKRHKK
jgi:hypothetical protein